MRRRPTGCAVLHGRGWGAWRGEWTSDVVLEDRGFGWVLRTAEGVRGRWSSYAEAVAWLWKRRSRRGGSPWAVGWSGYEACADAAGGLPVLESAPGELRGRWLIEPRWATAAGAEIEVDSANSRSPTCLSLDDRNFTAGVEFIRELIAAGSVYQVNLTRRFSIREWAGGVSPLLGATLAGGAPDYLALVRSDDHELVCASMELILRRRGRELETRPIKGTRPRGVDDIDDLRLAAELEGDAKERAELAMIVDLARNDLGRVAVSGSVAVADPGSVKSYASVHHRVARVTAVAKPAIPWWEIIAAVAPGGSITGCPKIAAMSAITELESCPRGPYTGILGVVAGNGDMELALPIRSAWAEGGSLHFSAGCGIVWESDPGAEEEESRLKVARWLELVERGGDDLAER